MNSGEALKHQVEELWEKHLPLMLSRIKLLQRAIEALDRGPIPDDLKRQAEDEAHKLSGSLGIFGLESASDSAHKIEMFFAAGNACSGGKVAEISHHLHLLKEAIDSHVRQSPSATEIRHV